VILFLGLCALCSLAVDLGHVQLVKTELRRCADATAHDYIALYNIGGKTYANANGPLTYSAGNNSTSTGIQPTVKVKWGQWDSATKTFTEGIGGVGVMAVRVTASCTGADNNAVPLTFAAILGKSKIDVTAVSVAASITQAPATVTVNATSNPYLAGMPSGTSSIYGDTTSSNGAIQVTSITVKPGTYLTFTGFTGTTSILPGTMPYVGPAGVSNYAYGTAVYHGQNWNGAFTTIGYSENGIGNAVMPESSLMGLFLSDDAPNTNAAPPTIDWTQPSVKDRTAYDSIELQQPFYIGDGQTGGGVVQKFRVPPGATRFYIGIWDGVGYFNNSGSLTGNINVLSTVQIVK
jgi:hypothetical protein